MGIALDMVMRATEKDERLSEANDKALKNSRKYGHKLIKQWTEFSNKQKEGKNIAEGINLSKNFQRDTDLTQQVDCFMCERNDDALAMGTKEEAFYSFRSAAKEIKIMREISKLTKYTQSMRRLFAQKWFVAMVFKLREYMKRMNNLVPMCCLKIVFIVRYIIELDFTFKESAFYEIIEFAGDSYYFIVIFVTAKIRFSMT